MFPSPKPGSEFTPPRIPERLVGDHGNVVATADNGTFCRVVPSAGNAGQPVAQQRMADVASEADAPDAALALASGEGAVELPDGFRRGVGCTLELRPHDETLSSLF